MARKRSFNWLLVVFIVAGLTIGFLTAQQPWRVYREQKVRAVALQSELKNLENSKLSHLEKKSKANNPVIMEEEARKQGYIQPGEVPLK
jgi:hypothetical protein